MTVLITDQRFEELEVGDGEHEVAKSEVKQGPFESVGLKGVHERFFYWVWGVGGTLLGDYYIQGDHGVFDPHLTGNDFFDEQFSDMAFVPFMYPLTYFCVDQISRHLIHRFAPGSKLDKAVNEYKRALALGTGFVAVTSAYELPQMLWFNSPASESIPDIRAYLVGALAMLIFANIGDKTPQEKELDVDLL